MRISLTIGALLGALFGASAARAAGPLGLARVAGQSDSGFLAVSSDPPAHVLIDDVDTNVVTPQPHIELKAGHHQLTLVTLDGARKRTLGFNVEVGQTTRLAIHLSP